MNGTKAALLGSENRGFTSLTIRIVACAALVMDCLYISGLGKAWMEGMRWIAYPVFAYLLAEGVEKSSSLRLYARRLILFTALGEVPYDLLRFGSTPNWKSQSSMLTLLIGFFCLVIIELLRKKADNLVVTGAASVLLAYGGTRLAGYLHSDFAAYGVYIIVILYIARHVTYEKILEFSILALLLVNITNASFFTIMISGLQYAIPIQCFSIIALILIWMYNGERGPNGRWLRTLFYVWYPLAMLIVAFIKISFR